MFKGAMTAIITPFKKGRVDEKKLAELVDLQIKGGAKAIVPCGTTGESATLSYEEHERVIEVVIEAVNKKVSVIAGTGSNNTSEAIMLTAYAKEAGASASLQITPYYNKPTQEGIFRHFKKIAEEVDLPMIVYNIASRTGVNITPETIERLSRVRNIVGVKEASGNLEQMSMIHQLCGKGFDLISGDDGLTLPLLSIGGTGVISVVSNIVPGDVSCMVSSFEKGDIVGARKLHYKLMPLVKAVFIETNPIPVKTAMALMGLIDSADLRLPMCAMSEANLAQLKKALKDYSLL
ncbi:MAG: 4-hydroxy-tetrahydrodipicolinate synthase [Candidatus Omnitrophica bacterium]|nr:4-hydroxy-tetrahydrodipicolinate synthase [Candidatus Omnitrophota bacterium]MBU1932668.1 4-hydroxy-tetrahydrodipicolinate synthase [Candidatus Omnitrophota bacterium]